MRRVSGGPKLPLLSDPCDRCSVTFLSDATRVRVVAWRNEDFMLVNKRTEKKNCPKCLCGHF